MDHKRDIFYFVILSLFFILPSIISRAEQDKFYEAEMAAEQSLQNHKLKNSRLLRQIVISFINQADIQIIRISNAVNMDSLFDPYGLRERRDKLRIQIAEARQKIEICKKNVRSECADEAFRDFEKISHNFQIIRQHN